jgi:hypothetical protein
MPLHKFPVRCCVRPAEGLAAGIEYPAPFAAAQSSEYRITLEGCPCVSGLAGNWYSYPEDQRQMYGMLDTNLFTIPGIGAQVTVKRALVGVGALLLVGWMLKA